MKNQGKIFVITGPTAVGKTEYAIKIAQRLSGEIVSCDSMQIYRHMDIGSAKPSKEERERIPHHLVDEVEPGEDFTVRNYQLRARQAIDDILARKKLPVIAGGTGLYLDSILYDMDFGSGKRDMEYRQRLKELADEQGAESLHHRLMEQDPESAKRIHPNNIKKVIRALEAVELGDQGIEDFSKVQKIPGPYKPLLIGLTREREELYRRINERVLRLFSEGLVEEVKGLLQRGLDSQDIAMKGIGYKEVISYLKGEYPLEEAVARVQTNTRHFAKRQMTWLRRYDDMIWFDLTRCEAEMSREEIVDKMVAVARTDPAIGREEQ